MFVVFDMDFLKCFNKFCYTLTSTAYDVWTYGLAMKPHMPQATKAIKSWPLKALQILDKFDSAIEM